jgi:hypothetical protein
LVASGFIDNKHLARAPIFGKENPTLLKHLSNCCPSVMRTIFMPGKIFYGRAWTILARQVSPREDMGRREGGRCLDPMK